MILSIFSGTLLAIVEAMAIVKGYQIISGTPAMVRLFARGNIQANGMICFGSLTLVSAVFILFPQTFIIGASLLTLMDCWLIYLQLSQEKERLAIKPLIFLVAVVVLICLNRPLCLFGCQEAHPIQKKPVAVCR